MTPLHSRIETPLPASVRAVEDPDRLPRLDVATAAATARVFFHGAQITQWTPSHAAQSVLWTSAHSQYRPDRPIRGGVPICFPWFGPHPGDPAAPAHGFVRLADWTLVEAAEGPEGTVTLAFALDSDDETRRRWPHQFRILHRLSIGTALTMTLIVENRGEAPFRFEEALHSYFALGDVRRMSIAGLEDAEYLDKVAGFARRRQGPDPLVLTAETDRVYADTTAECRIDDALLRRRIAIAKSASRSTVVWNPWIERARAFADFGTDEWREMVCVETANVGPGAVELAPGRTHTMSAAIRVVPL